jgi:hypothetical protein
MSHVLDSLFNLNLKIKQLNDLLHNLYSSANIIRMIKSRRMRWARHGRDKKCVQNLFGKPEGKRLLGRSRRRWEDNTEMYLRGVYLGGMDWIHLAQDIDR